VVIQVITLVQYCYKGRGACPCCVIVTESHKAQSR
jgi:hypothetical protein